MSYAGRVEEKTCFDARNVVPQLLMEIVLEAMIKAAKSKEEGIIIRWPIDLEY